MATLATFLPLLALSASYAAELNPVQNNSAWNLPPGTHVEGDTLVVEIAPEATGRRDVRAAAEIDVSDAFAAMQSVAATVAVRGVGVSEPPHAWQGVKVQLSYTDFFGDRVYRDAALPRGTFDRTNVTVRVSPLLAPLGIPGGRVSLLLGLEGCSGRAEFDLSSLRIDREDTGIPRVNGDWIVRYPHDKGLSTNPQIRNCSQITNDNSGALGDHAISDEANLQAGPWSVEHETAAPGRPSVPAANTPRKRALLEGLGLGSAPASAAP